MTTVSQETTSRRWVLPFLAAIVAVLATILSSASASAATTSVAETRVRASAVVVEPAVGPPQSVSAGERLGKAGPRVVDVVATGVAAKAGPGAWGTAAESMSSRAAAYQARITGRSAGSVYNVNGVKFDGFANGVLQEAKGPGYANFVRNGQFQPWFSGADGLVSQAQRQLAAAGGTPITWSVAEGPAATAINNLFVSRGISGINVIHVP